MLEVEQLSVCINGKYIVKDSSFFVPRGKITSIIGESGSGKSMTISAVLGTFPKIAKVTGRILFNGVNLMGLPNQEMAALRKTSIFTIFQDVANSFNPSEKIGRQLFALSGQRMGDSVYTFKEKMKLILNDLELGLEILEQYPFELSGGMLQRCMIACSLYMEPELLIADEPTSALDMVVQKEFVGLLKRLNEVRGTTILLITHDLDIVVEAAEQVVVMYVGEVVETGPVRDVFEHPAHSYTERLLASRF